MKALVVEAEAVDQRFALRQAEHARLGIAGLRFRRDRADLDEAEAHGCEGVDAACVLVEPGGKADLVGKAQPCQRDRVFHARGRVDAGQRRVLRAGQPVEREFVRMLRVEAEQERAGEGVGQQQRHRIIQGFRQTTTTQDSPR